MTIRLRVPFLEGEMLASNPEGSDASEEQRAPETASSASGPGQDAHVPTWNQKEWDRTVRRARRVTRDPKWALPIVFIVSRPVLFITLVIASSLLLGAFLAAHSSMPTRSVCDC
jgi:hypothetical protein